MGEWYDLARDVEGLLVEHHAAIPASRQQRIREILRLPEATVAGARQACSVLQLEVESLLGVVGAASGAGTAILAGFIVLAVAVGAVAGVSNATAVDVRVFNRGCDPVYLTSLPLSNTPVMRAAGITLPGAPILDGGDDVISLPPVRLDVESDADTGQMVLRALQRIELPVALGRATDISFDGQPILSRRITLDLRLNGRPEHELVISCAN